MRALPIAALLIAATGCGAEGTTPRPAEPSPTAHASPADDEATPEADPPTDEAEDPEPEPPPPPPPPEPVVVEGGVRLGPIRIGMTEAELRALGLEEGRVDPRTLRFGPYRVKLDDGAVEEVEASLGDLERVRIADRVFDTDSHIHAIRDALGDCVWQEGGGERYRCRDGHLWVETTHSLAPERYAIRVE